MDRALEAARLAAAAGEVPVGACLVGPAGEILAVSGNLVERGPDPTAHAEIVVLREGARRLGTPRLVDCELHVTLEPCPMCAFAVSLARIRRLYFGAEDPKAGGVVNGPRLFDSPCCHHRPEVYGGIGERESAELLRRFFRARR